RSRPGRSPSAWCRIWPAGDLANLVDCALGCFRSSAHRRGSRGIPVHPTLAAVIAETPTPSSDFLDYWVQSAVHGELFRSMVSRAVRHGGFASLQRAWMRKAAARRLAEAGCTAHEIAAITGHASLNEVQRY